MDFTENRTRNRKSRDVIWANAGFRAVEKKDLTRLRYLSILSCLIFASNVERGMPSLAAAPPGPATFPLLAAKAASTSPAIRSLELPKFWHFLRFCHSNFLFERLFSVKCAWVPGCTVHNSESRSVARRRIL